MADLDGLPPISRRQLLKGGAAVAALGGVSAFLAACGASSTPSPATQAPASTAPESMAPSSTAPESMAPLGGQIHVGSNHSDPAEKDGMDAINKAFQDATGVEVVMNTVDHGTFQDQITNYLGGTPDTAYTWFSGFRMKFFADQGLNVPIDDVWSTVSSNFTEGFANSVVGNDGKIYGIPVDYYPWAVFYRKSVFADNNYSIPTTWDELIALCKQMQSDGLTPIAFGDKDGWPAMGTFDILNLRLNGYDFHVGLMAGSESWTDPKVTAVFEQWKEFLPYHAKDYAGLTWQQAADTLVQKKAGMYLLGLFVSSQFTATNDPADIADLDFFPFPYMGNEFDAEQALDAPIDTWEIAAKSPYLQDETDNWKAYLEFWAKGSTQLLMFQNQPGFIPTASDTDTSTYSDLQKKAVEIVSAAKKITQFLDRDTRSDFAGANGMQSFLLTFLANPNQDLAAFQQSIQSFWESLPPLT